MDLQHQAIRRYLQISRDILIIESDFLDIIESDFLDIQISRVFKSQPWMFQILEVYESFTRPVTGSSFIPGTYLGYLGMLVTMSFLPPIKMGMVSYIPPQIKMPV
jgi:hypothetical protein